MTVIVTFNRALYAQLAQQQFQPPRGYPLPPLNSPAFRAAELGMKLTCGFEMVMAKGSLGTVLLPQPHFCLCLYSLNTVFPSPPTSQASHFRVSDYWGTAYLQPVSSTLAVSAVGCKGFIEFV